eukprot:gene19334-13160_t
MAADPRPPLQGIWTQPPFFAPVCDNTDPAGIPCTGDDPVVPNGGNNRRDEHHITDAPLLGNGNVGVVVAGGLDGWIDLYISTNSFWALRNSSNYTTPDGDGDGDGDGDVDGVGAGRGALPGPICPGRACDLPGTMAMGTVRIGLPNGWGKATGATYRAVQDITAASVTVSITKGRNTKKQATNITEVIELSLFVSPFAPIIWSTATYRVTGGDVLGNTRNMGNNSSIELNLTSRVKDHFYANVTWGHPNPSRVDTFKTATTAVCNSGGVTATSLELNSSSSGGISGLSAAPTALAPFGVVTRESYEANGPKVIKGGILTNIYLPDMQPDQVQCHVSGVTSTVQSFAIQPGQTATMATVFYNASSISTPAAPETEDFWNGAMYIFGSSIPKA